MSLSGIAKFFVGFIVGILVLAVGGAAVAYYFWTQLSVIPAKPTFAEERPKATPVAKKSTSTASKSTSKQPSVSESPEKPLPPGAYKARVSWEEGLILRDSPGPDANRIGGMTFNQEIIVLKESDDHKWQQVQSTQGDQQGWIKAGNLEKLDQ